MCPMTPGAALAMLAYNITVFVTLIMAVVLRYERWWMGLVVMVGLILFAIIESFCWVVFCMIDDVVRYLRARKIQDEEERAHEMKRHRDNIDPSLLLVIPFVMGLMVAILGLVAIPVLVYSWISDSLSKIHEEYIERKNLA